MAQRGYKKSPRRIAPPRDYGLIADSYVVLFTEPAVHVEGEVGALTGDHQRKTAVQVV